MPHYLNRAMAYDVVKIRTSDGLELDRTIVVAVDDEQALTTGQQFLEDIAVCDAIVHYEVVLSEDTDDGPVSIQSWDATNN